MKIENEVTGILRVVEKETWNVVDLFSNGVKLGEFVFNPKHKSINVELSKCMGKILGINVTEYLDYMKLIADLGLEIPKSYRRHWVPAEEWSYYSITQGGNVESLESYKELSSARFRKENYNAFPTRDLAEKGKNLSKLGRLILLWQYANDCIFEPDWKNNDKKIYCIKFDHINKEISYYYNIYAQLDTVYFQTKEQSEAFIEMYETEIKKIMGVI